MHVFIVLDGFPGLKLNQAAFGRRSAHPDALEAGLRKQL